MDLLDEGQSALRHSIAELYPVLVFDDLVVWLFDVKVSIVDQLGLLVDLKFKHFVIHLSSQKSQI